MGRERMGVQGKVRTRWEGDMCKEMRGFVLEGDGEVWGGRMGRYVASENGEYNIM